MSPQRAHTEAWSVVLRTQDHEGHELPNLWFPGPTSTPQHVSECRPSHRLRKIQGAGTAAVEFRRRTREKTSGFRVCDVTSRMCRYTRVISPCFPPDSVALLGTVWNLMLSPPALEKGQKRSLQARSKKPLGNSGCTHTHTQRHTDLEFLRKR